MSRLRLPALELALYLLVAILLAHAVDVLCAGLTQPISDLHGFRQAQTALSTYWLAHGGPWLAYETPALGAPWSVPFELPVYQSLVALLGAAGAPIVIAGRIVSFAFFIGLLWPLAVLFRSLELGRVPFLVIAALLLASPLYLFWSRTFMIELCALFFSLLWLASLSRLLLRPSVAWFALAVLSGVLGINAKSTTFAGFGVLGAMMICWRAFLGWRRGVSREDIGAVALAVAACVLPLASGLAWVGIRPG